MIGRTGNANPYLLRCRGSAFSDKARRTQGEFRDCLMGDGAAETVWNADISTGIAARVFRQGQARITSYQERIAGGITQILHDQGEEENCRQTAEQ